MRARLISQILFLAGLMSLQSGTFSSEPVHWSLQPLRRPPLPEVKERARVQTPIDLFVLSELERRQMHFAPPADRRILIRRIYFDLLGLPPPPAEIDSFVQDADPDAVRNLIDRLLESPQYGERWARHWLDIVHYAETHGHDQDRPRTNAWPYRDYVIEAFNSDKPYARFVEEQIAGDILYPADPQATVALGFLAAGPWDESSLRDIREDSTDRQVARYIDRDDIVTTTMNTFTSTTVQCARCHNHKFDPITTAEYYGLQAVFAGTEKGNRYYDDDPQLHQRRQRLLKRNRAIKNRDAKMLADLQSAEFQSKVSKWESSVRDSVLQWKPLMAMSAIGETEITLKTNHNGTIWSRGKTAETNTYHLVFEAGDPGITALQLEVLPDLLFPNDGPGRSETGNFHLTQVRIRFATASATNEIKVESAIADFNQKDYGIDKAFDADPKSGWGIYPKTGQPHAAIIKFAAPTPECGRLLIDLVQNHGGYHLIARFRVLAMSSPPPAHVTVLPEPIADALRTDPGERCPCEDEEITWFLADREIDQDLAELPPAKLVYAGAHEFVRDANHKPIGKVRPVHVLRRGELKLAGEEAQPGALSCVAGLSSELAMTDPADEGLRRAALARWISDSRNVLAWRSIVNRVWQYHFGRGIVATPNDFGKMGEPPTHPELLDWLAIWFQENGGSIKSLHRLILLSAVYQQSSAGNPEFAQRDADNRLLWRMTPARLDAEEVRDAILCLTKKLDLTMGGPSAQQFVMTPGIHVTPNVDYTKFDVDSAASYRRSIYRFLFRTLPDPLMENLDCPDGAQSAPTRNNSVTVLQALSMWNNRFIVRQSEHFATRLEKSLPGDPEGQVMLACRLAFGRAPSSEEKSAMVSLSTEYGLPNLCRVIFNSNEFIFVH